MRACFRGKFLAWSVVLGLALLLVTLLVATGETIRHAEIASPLTQPVEPDLSLDGPPFDDTYHDPGLAVWRTP
jgi:hypothetical protein